MSKRVIWHIGLSTQQPWDNEKAGKIRVDILRTHTTAKNKIDYHLVEPGSASFKRALNAVLKFVGFEGKADDQSECAYCGTRNPGDPCRKCGAQK